MTLLSPSFYPYQSNSQKTVFSFISVGQSMIRKLVQFDILEEEFYTMSLGDELQSGEISLFNISNNGDMRKVLTTVAFCLADFLQFHPTSQVLFWGSTSSRNNLYGRLINRYFEEIESLDIFSIFGMVQENPEIWESINPTKLYLAYVVSLKLQTPPHHENDTNKR